MMLIKQMELDILEQWSQDAIDIINANTSKYLLIKTSKGLIAPNFDESVSSLPAVILYETRFLCYEEQVGF